MISSTSVYAVTSILFSHVDARTRLAMQASYQKVRGQQKSVKYPQPEFNLGDAFTRTGAGINDDSPYCKSYCRMAFDKIYNKFSYEHKESS